MNPLKILLPFGTLTPILIIAISYSIMVKRVVRVRSHLAESMSNQNLRKFSSKEVQITRTVVFICLTFFCLYVPCALIMVFDPMPPNGDLAWLHVVFYIVFWSSAFVNPFIYFLTNKNYRKAMLKTFGLYQKPSLHQVNLVNVRSLEKNSSQT